MTAIDGICTLNFSRACLRSWPADASEISFVNNEAVLRKKIGNIVLDRAEIDGFRIGCNDGCTFISHCVSTLAEAVVPTFPFIFLRSSKNSEMPQRELRGKINGCI